MIRRFLYGLSVLLLCVAMPMQAFAETGGASAAPEASRDGRALYVGDILTLQIAADGLSEAAIVAAFDAFELIALEKTPGGYDLSLRTFETGTHTVRIGDKEIVFHVASTLSDIDRDDIFEGGAQAIEPGFSIPWRALFYIAAGVFALSGGFALLKNAPRKKAKALAPYPLFQHRAAALSAEDDRYLVDMTHCFKTYIEGVYSCRIIGKTTAETVRTLQEVEALDAALPDVQAWLSECDRLKFTGARASDEHRLAHYQKMLSLAAQIHAQSAGQAAGAKKEGEAS